MKQQGRITLLFTTLVLMTFSHALHATDEQQVRSGNKRVMEVLPEDSELSELKKSKLSEEASPNAIFSHTSSHEQETHKAQIYSIPTYDATFKYMLGDAEIRLSFLKTFALTEHIISANPLDEHLRPLHKYQTALSTINHKDSKSLMSKVSALVNEESATDDSFQVTYTDNDDNEYTLTHGGWFIKSFAGIYGDLLNAFPKKERNSQVDLLCKLQDGSFALVEVQVIPQDFWDQRALAYAADIYARQLKSGDKWEDLKKVICINILGGGVDKLSWETHTGFKHIQFKDQHNFPLEGGIEIFQYPLYHQETLIEATAKTEGEVQKTALKEWLDFLESAASKKAEEVEVLQTAEVRKAYDKIKPENLPEDVRKANLAQEEEQFRAYSQYTETLSKKAKEEGREEGERKKTIDIARKMLKKEKSIEEISDITDLSIDEIEALKAEILEESKAESNQMIAD